MDYPTCEKCGGRNDKFFVRDISEVKTFEWCSCLPSGERKFALDISVQAEMIDRHLKYLKVEDGSNGEHSMSFDLKLFKWLCMPFAKQGSVTKVETNDEGFVVVHVKYDEPLEAGTYAHMMNAYPQSNQDETIIQVSDLKLKDL